MPITDAYGRFSNGTLLTPSGVVYELFGIFDDSFQVGNGAAHEIKESLLEQKESLAISNAQLKPLGDDINLVILYDTGTMKSYGMKNLVMGAVINAYAKEGHGKDIVDFGFGGEINIVPYISELVKL